jgi:hypothetical protein
VWQLKTRSFATTLGELMLPVVDLANHHNGCQHSITTYADCRSLTTGDRLPGGCVVWRAEVPVPAGEEVCNSYHSFMLQDRALLQYGMLQMRGGWVGEGEWNGGSRLCAG